MSISYLLIPLFVRLPRSERKAFYYCGIRHKKIPVEKWTNAQKSVK